MSRIFNGMIDADVVALKAIVSINPNIKVEFIRYTWYKTFPEDQRWHLRKRNYYKVRGEMRQIRFKENELYRIKEDQS